LLLTACGQKGALYLPADKPLLEKQQSQATEVEKAPPPQQAEAESSPEPDGHMP